MMMLRRQAALFPIAHVGLWVNIERARRWIGIASATRVVTVSLTVRAWSVGISVVTVVAWLQAILGADSRADTALVAACGALLGLALAGVVRGGLTDPAARAPRWFDLASVPISALLLLMATLQLIGDR